jgi:hypothetical protein
MARMNLYEKIQAVATSITNIEKNANVGGKYKAVTDADVIATVKAYEQQHGLVSIPYKQEVLRDENIPTTNSYGKAVLMHSLTIKMTTKIVDVKKPEDFIEVESIGYGWDNGDKGAGKASTYARKYALLNAYKIITGEDPDFHLNEDYEAGSPPQEQPVQPKLSTDKGSITGLQTAAMSAYTDASEDNYHMLIEQLEKKEIEKKDLTESQANWFLMKWGTVNG